jgi:ABC-type sugar transport system ATPase subunit
VNQARVSATDHGQSQEPAAVLRCVGIAKYFGAVRALNHVDLEVRSGEVVALVGDNGAGKSTLVKIISGVHRPDAGEIWLGDRMVKHLTPTQARDWGIETVHQHLALCDNLNAAANVVLGREPVSFRLGPFRFVNWKKAIAEAREGIDELGVRLDSFTTPVRRFSGGQRQAVSIARANVRGARFVIFDEPTAALGVRQKKTTLELIKRVADRGLGVLLISHNLDEIYAVTQRIVVLRLGAVVLEGATASVSREQAVLAMTGIEMGARA